MEHTNKLQAFQTGTFIALCLSVINPTVQAQDGLEIPVYKDTAAAVRHSGFTLEYAEPYEQASWVAYEFDSVKARASIPRTDNYRIDPFVPTGSAGTTWIQVHRCPRRPYQGLWPCF